MSFFSLKHSADWLAPKRTQSRDLTFVVDVHLSGFVFVYFPWFEEGGTESDVTSSLIYVNISTNR